MIGFFTGVEAFFTGLSRIHRLLPWILAYLLLLPLPFLLKFGISEYYVDLANRACLFILLSVGLNIVKGFCGQVTVGHIGLYAIGAVTSALLAINYQLHTLVNEVRIQDAIVVSERIRELQEMR